MTFHEKTVNDEDICQAMLICSINRSTLMLRRVIKQHSWVGILVSLVLAVVGIISLWQGQGQEKNLEECNAIDLVKTTLIGVLIILPGVLILSYHVVVITRTRNDDYETVFKMNKMTCLLLSVEGLPLSLFATCGILQEKKQPIRTYLIFRKILMLLSFVLIVFFAAISLLQMIVGIPVLASMAEEEESQDMLKYSVLGLTACCAAFAVWNQYIILFYVIHLNMMDNPQTTKLDI